MNDELRRAMIELADDVSMVDLRDRALAESHRITRRARALAAVTVLTAVAALTIGIRELQDAAAVEAAFERRQQIGVDPHHRGQRRGGRGVADEHALEHPSQLTHARRRQLALDLGDRFLRAGPERKPGRRAQ
jgi:hypothetical protein